MIIHHRRTPQYSSSSCGLLMNDGMEATTSHRKTNCKECLQWLRKYKEREIQEINDTLVRLQLGASK